MPMKICRKLSCRIAANSSAGIRTPINASRKEVIPVNRDSEPCHQSVHTGRHVRRWQFAGAVHDAENLFAPRSRPQQRIGLPQEDASSQGQRATVVGQSRLHVRLEFIECLRAIAVSR